MGCAAIYKDAGQLEEALTAAEQAAAAATGSGSTTGGSPRAGSSSVGGGRGAGGRGCPRPSDDPQQPGHVEEAGRAAGVGGPLPGGPGCMAGVRTPPLQPRGSGSGAGGYRGGGGALPQVWG